MNQHCILYLTKVIISSGWRTECDSIKVLAMIENLLSNQISIPSSSFLKIEISVTFAIITALDLHLISIF